MLNVAPLLAALEYAKFSEPEVRLKLVQTMRSLEEDLNDVGYDPGVGTKQRFSDLEELLDSLSEPKTTTSTEDEEDIEAFIKEKVNAETEGD
jgi:hypothetical protein